MPREVKIQLAYCDNCGKAVPGSIDGELPWGFHGRVMHIGSHGGDGGEWFACSKKCIRNAVLAADDFRNDDGEYDVNYRFPSPGGQGMG